MFLTVNTELLTMLMTSLARDADALGSIKVEVEVEAGGPAEILIHHQNLDDPPPNKI